MRRPGCAVEVSPGVGVGHEPPHRTFLDPRTRAAELDPSEAKEVTEALVEFKRCFPREDVSPESLVRDTRPTSPRQAGLIW